MYKTSELRDKSVEELEVLIQDSKKRLFELNHQFKSQKKIDQPHKIHHARKDIARLLTIITEKRNNLIEVKK